MKTIYLIRHGRTAWNKDRRFQGHQDVGLNSEGWRQAELVGKKLKGVPLKFVVSSDLLRSRQTAYGIMKHQKGTIYIETNLLREGYGGMLEGKLFSFMFPNSEIGSLNSLRELNDFDGETYLDIIGRAWKGLQNVFDKLDEGESAAVVSHGGPLRLILSKIMGEDFSKGIKMKLNNCSISQVSMISNKITLNTYNETDYLKPKIHK